MKNILIISLPRSGSSLLSNLLNSANYNYYIAENSSLINKSCFNVNGYFEDTQLTLLNDQLIRISHGSDCSFLYPSAKFNIPIDYSDFYYDLDDVYFPNDHIFDVKKYTGCDWDVWGLTRMGVGEKWHKCYSRYEVDSGKNIQKTLSKILNQFKAKNNLIIKDPRFALVYPFYNSVDFKIIYIKRDKSDILTSMRKHYGKNLFTENYFENTFFCSNHFNYKVKYQNFEDYFEIYTNYIKNFITNKDCLTIDYETIRDSKTISNINDFIGSKVDENIIIK
jgi:hypothetical protein